jgi:hypothetical protein
MEKNRDLKLVLVTVLTVGIVGLSIGFAAFSNVLRINSSAKVSPDENTFNVDFSTVDSEVKDGTVIPTMSASTLTDYEPAVPMSATNAKIDNTGDPTISNLNATFNAPGQKAVYSFYAYNSGELDAYLKSIVYANANGQTSNKVCTAGQGTTDALVQKACDGIVVKVKVGNEAETTSGLASITNHQLLKSASEPVTVTIEYLENSAVADGDFTVSFGDISLNYSSAD